VADGLNLHDKIELRRAITTSALTMIALVTVIGLFTLFSIWSINRAWTAGTLATSELQDLSRAALDSQVNFKVQIQEWKNVLLRGDDSAALEKHLTSFRAHAQKTEDDLRRVFMGTTKLGFKEQMEWSSVLSNEHEALTLRYEEVLAEGRGMSTTITPDLARLIDESVRGADRDLEARISKLSEAIASISDERRNSLLVQMQDRYVSLRLFILAVIGLSLVITAYVLSSALRATRASR
jgi:methyl-accepting chemotaxis protein